jgi:hypothetical protein
MVRRHTFGETPIAEPPPEELNFVGAPYHLNPQGI